MKDIQPDPKRFERGKKTCHVGAAPKDPMTRHAREKNRGPRAVLFQTGANTVTYSCVKWRKTSRGHVGLVEAGEKKTVMPLRT